MTIIPEKKLKILVADDDPDDRLLIKEAIEEAGSVNWIEFVNDGVELMEYLHRRGAYADRNDDLPDIILLDLNMPRKDGREVLAEIRADPNLRHTPVAILTTSKAEDDVRNTYDTGASAYIVKPATFTQLVETMKGLVTCWQDIKIL